MMNPATEAIQRIKNGESREAVLAEVAAQDAPAQAEIVMPDAAPSVQRAEAGDIDVSLFAAEESAQPEAAPKEEPAQPAEASAEASPDEQPTKRRRGRKPVDENASKIDDLMAQIADLQTKLAATSVAAAPAAPAPSFELSAEEKETFGEDAAVALDAFLRRRGLTPDLIASLSEAKNLKAKVEGSEEAAFMNAVQKEIPDMDDILKDPEWRAYAKERAPFTQKTKGEMLLAAYNARDTASVVEIFKGFVGDDEPVKTLETIARPSRSTAPSNPKPGVAPHRVVLAASKLAQAAMQERQGNITKAELLKIQDIYRVAEKEGRVNYNA